MAGLLSLFVATRRRRKTRHACACHLFEYPLRGEITAFNLFIQRGGDIDAEVKSEIVLAGNVIEDFENPGFIPGTVITNSH